MKLNKTVDCWGPVNPSSPTAASIRWSKENSSKSLCAQGTSEDPKERNKLTVLPPGRW